MNMIRKIRYFIIKLLFTKEEKYLLARACETRRDALYKLAVTEKTIDYYDAAADIKSINIFSRHIFSTNLYY
jgi:hypothetical protein